MAAVCRENSSIHWQSLTKRYEVVILQGLQEDQRLGEATNVGCCPQLLERCSKHNAGRKLLCQLVLKVACFTGVEHLQSAYCPSKPAGSFASCRHPVNPPSLPASFAQ
eukprot:scaffold431_cov334-Pavlova_lutheri.AAC.15